MVACQKSKIKIAVIDFVQNDSPFNIKQMSQQITIEVSEQVLQHASQIAELNQQRVEDVLSTWLETVVNEKPVEELSDDELLALTELKLTDKEQESLSNLLERNREGSIEEEEKRQLDNLMRTYERGLLRKSQALRIAVERGLLKPLEP